MTIDDRVDRQGSGDGKARHRGVPRRRAGDDLPHDDAIEIDEELLNRCIVLTVDENREQTRAIYELQRNAQTLESLLTKRGSALVLRVGGRK